jgi:hypothetical protein
MLLQQGIKFSEKTKAVLAYIRVPAYGENLNTRPIQYANEKVQFPVLSPEKVLHNVIDDEIDDAEVASSSRLSPPRSVDSSSQIGGGAINAADYSRLEKRLEAMEGWMKMAALETTKLASSVDLLVGMMKNLSRREEK